MAHYSQKKLFLLFLYLGLFVTWFTGCTQPVTANVRWRSQINEEVLAAPFITEDGFVYIASANGHVQVRRADGSFLRDFTLPTTIKGNLASDNYGTIYIPGENGFLYAFNAEGHLRWKFQTEGSLLSGPFVFLASTVYLGTSSGMLYALNFDGTLYWQHKLEGAILVKPMVSHGRLYIGTAEGNLYNYSLWGEPQWPQPVHLNSAITTVPIASSDGHVFIGSGDNQVQAVLPHGHILWNKDVGAALHKNPYFIDSYNTSIFQTVDNSLQAFQIYGPLEDYFSLTNSKQLKETKLPLKNLIDAKGISTGDGVVGADGRFYYFAQNQVLTCLDTSGRTRWQLKLNVSPVSDLAIAHNNTVYFVGTDGYLYAVRERTLD